MFMRKRILKWKRDRAVDRLSRNCRVLDQMTRDLNTYLTTVPEEERRLRVVQNNQYMIEQLKLSIDDDKHFIRTTA